MTMLTFSVACLTGWYGCHKQLYSNNIHVVILQLGTYVAQEDTAVSYRDVASFFFNLAWLGSCQALVQALKDERGGGYAL